MDLIIKNLLLLLVILSAIPIGLLIARYTRDEIRKGKVELRLLEIASAIVFVISSLVVFEEQALVMVISAFVFVLCISSLWSIRKK